MSSFARLSLSVTLVVGLVAGLISCGAGGTNNNQGRSFRANRYCSAVDCSAGETGRIVPLSTDASALSGGVQGGILGLVPLDGQTIITFLELESFLTTQFIRVDRIDCRYTVPGADPALRIPEDSFAAGATLNEIGAGGASIAILGFEIISPDFFAFLNASRNLLPLLPFRAVATCSATGVTAAGDTLTSNELNYTIQFGEASECCTGQNGEVPGTLGGFQGGAGTGAGVVETTSTTGNATGEGAVAEEGMMEDDTVS